MATIKLIRITRPTRERLLELLDYNPETGIFTWKLDKGGHIMKGKLAGNMNCSRERIGIDGKSYKTAVLTWVIVHGYWPTTYIDHIDGNTTNNRISNLREATPSQSAMNRSTPSNNTSGIKGVRWNSKGEVWEARIQVNNKVIQIGSFKSLVEAAEARKKAETKYFGKFKRDNQ